ncbi:MAG: hypothetical protein KDB65_01805 [Calditrichaeota bacterium]|nr:hypothetical protein [Calditrichota bacterium]
MSRASWSILIFGILAMFAVSCDKDSGDDGELPDDFAFKTVLRCDGPLTADCAGDVSITEYTQVRIFHDWNRNGPDEQDYCPIPPGHGGSAESWFATFADFYFNGSSFTSPVLRCSSWGGWEPSPYNSFYLRAYSGDGEHVVWTSPSFSLLAHSGLPDTVDLPADQWTCELTEADPPQCLVMPGHFSTTDYYQTRDTTCIETCIGGQSVVFFRYADTTNADRIPILKISGSCDDTPDGAVSFFPADWRAEGFDGSWILPVLTGEKYGKVSITWLESVPCTDISHLIVMRTDSNSVVGWHSIFEDECAAFEIWLLGLPESSGTSTLLGEVPATRSADGSDYVFYAPRLQAGYSYNFTLVAVDDDGNKYPCKRVMSSS